MGAKSAPLVLATVDRTTGQSSGPAPQGRRRRLPQATSEMLTPQLRQWKKPWTSLEDAVLLPGLRASASGATRSESPPQAPCHRCRVHDHLSPWAPFRACYASRTAATWVNLLMPFPCLERASGPHGLEDKNAPFVELDPLEGVVEGRPKAVHRCSESSPSDSESRFIETPQRAAKTL